MTITGEPKQTARANRRALLHLRGSDKVYSCYYEALQKMPL